MARFSLNGSYRADTFLRLMQAAEALLEDELDPRNASPEDATSEAGWISNAADVALVLGMTREQWLAAYDENEAYYREHGISLK